MFYESLLEWGRKFGGTGRSRTRFGESSPRMGVEHFWVLVENIPGSVRSP